MPSSLTKLLKAASNDDPMGANFEMLKLVTVVSTSIAAPVAAELASRTSAHDSTQRFIQGHHDRFMQSTRSCRESTSVPVWTAWEPRLSNTLLPVSLQHTEISWNLCYYHHALILLATQFNAPSLRVKKEVEIRPAYLIACRLVSVIGSRAVLTRRQMAM